MHSKSAPDWSVRKVTCNPAHLGMAIFRITVRFPRSSQANSPQDGQKTTWLPSRNFERTSARSKRHPKQLVWANTVGGIGTLRGQTVRHCCLGPTLLQPSSQGSRVNPDRAEAADDGEPAGPRHFVKGLFVVSENISSFPDRHVSSRPTSKFFQDCFHVYKYSL